MLDAMLADPIVINRVIVARPLGKKLCRPSEAVLDVLRTPSTPRRSRSGRGGRAVDLGLSCDSNQARTSVAGFMPNIRLNVRVRCAESANPAS